MSAATANVGTDVKAKTIQLRTQLSSLRIQLQNLQALPLNISDIQSGALDRENQKLATQLASLEEKTILYRSAGWTCFEIDLDVGRRARDARRVQGGPDLPEDRGLGLGIRLDTFWRGRFLEPYYLVLAQASQLLEQPQLSSTTVGGTGTLDTSDELRLVRHTIPHFVPLENLVEKYLPSLLGGLESGGSGSNKMQEGGLSLLEQFQDLPGVEPFLSDLHCHLQAYVSRREQALSLRQLKLPRTEEDAEAPSGVLDAFGTDGFDLIKVVWRISSHNQEEAREDSAAAGPDVDRDGAEPAAKRRKENNKPDVPVKSLEMMVQYMDLRSDRLVDDTLAVPSTSLADAAIDKDDMGAPRPKAIVHEPFKGTRRPFGQVRIDMVVALPLSQRIQQGEDDRIPEQRRTRRTDLELLFADQRDGEGLELDEALQSVIETVWSEEEPNRENMTISKRRTINPNPYADGPPDFAKLAELYPDGLGRFVKLVPKRGSEGEWWGTLDFHNAEAIRCLSETLLFHDFGIKIRLSDRHLCPMVPNRLNYMVYMRKVLETSLSWFHIAKGHVRKRHGGETIRGLDIGTGAAAIYPLLGCAIEPTWHFLATDIDAESLKIAKTLIDDPINNNDVQVTSQHLCINHRLSERISLLHRQTKDSLIPSATNLLLHFTMCNPPFYSSQEDMNASANLKEEKPNAVCHGTPGEMITQGGEVAFVKRMIDESLERKDVLWFSSMVGKLSSIFELVTHLRSVKIDNYAINKLTQGQTGRWVVTWTHTHLRLGNSLSRIPDYTLDRFFPPSSSRTLSLPGSLAIVTSKFHTILASLEGCQVYGMDVAMWLPSWTRAARREKARGLTKEKGNELVIGTRWSMIEVIEEVRLNVDWAYGSERGMFESFVSHVYQKLQTG